MKGIGRRCVAAAARRAAITIVRRTLCGAAPAVSAAVRTRAFAAVAITASAGLASWQLAEGAPAPPTHERSVTDDYVIGEELGSGSFAQVFSGRCRSTGKLVAIKVVHKSRQSAASIRHELATLQRVSLHKCVASLEAYYESDDCFHIVMELVSGGELFERLVEYGAFSEREAAELLQDLGGAIALLHAQGLCHADLKPENLLLTDAGYVKLVDFGLSAEHAPDATAGASIKPVGTPAYWPPELHNGKERRPTSAGDMWALGVVLYILLTGAHPFDDSFDHVLRRNVLRRGVDWTGWPASAQARSVVESLLRTEPDERLTIEQLLQHPWLREAAPATDTPIDPDMRARETEIERFRRNSARLRAAVFAVMVAQLAADRKEEAEEALAAAEAVERTRRLRERKESNASRSHELRRRNSMRANLLDQDLLSRAFRAFDITGKGYIAEADLQRVLGSFGIHIESESELHAILEAAAGYDREARRVTYGNYVRTMSHTLKETLDTGERIFTQGEPPRYFYLLLSGEVALAKEHADEAGATGPLHTVSDALQFPLHVRTVEAGEVFGENALLGALLGAATDPPRARSLTATCTQPTEVLKLSKADFDVGFLGRDQPIGTPDEQLAAIEMLLGPGSVDPATIEEAMRRSARETLLRFIQMVTGSHAVGTYRRGEAVFRAGDTVDKLYIVSSGRFQVLGPEEAARVEAVTQAEAEAAAAATRAAAATAGGTLGEKRVGWIKRRFTSMSPPVVTQPPPRAVGSVVREGECIGEMSLLAGNATHSKSVLCASDRCKAVAVDGVDFLRIIRTSAVVRDSFEQLSKRRTEENISGRARFAL